MKSIATVISYLILTLLIVCVIETECDETIDGHEMLSLSDIAFRLIKTSTRKQQRVVRTGRRQTFDTSQMKVGIVGAGLSGLYAALLLQDLGIDYEILEASNRIGGRYHTFHFDDSNYNYVELGAMRLPTGNQFERLTGKQNWSLINYLNSKVDENRKLEVIPFQMNHPNGVYYINGVRKLKSEVENSGDLFGYSKTSGGFIDPKYTEKNPDFWEEEAFKYILNNSNNQSKAYQFLMENDYQTFRGFLMNPKYDFAYPCDVVDWMEDVSGQTGRFSFSFMDVFLELTMFSNEFVTIDGGISRITDALNSLLRNPPKLQHAVTRVNQKRNKNLILDTNKGQFEYTHIIMTPQFSAMRDIYFDCDLHLKSEIAMRNVRYASAVKIGFEFKTRFWENETLMNDKPIFGGQSTTDLTIRKIVYPSYGINCTTCKGAILVSYTLFRDAMKISGISVNNLVEIALRDLTAIHGSVVKEQFTGKYEIMDWSEYEWTQGALASFEPGYFTSYYSDLIYPDADGRILFSGDTLSVYHGWSIGALVSAYRSVKDILTIHKMEDKLNELKSNWGTIDEPDFSNYQ